MSERDGYEAGTPAWIDLTTTDPQDAMRFYAGLFGWELDQGGAESGGYVMCRLDGRPVAGINGQPGPAGFPPAWITYLATDDADATAEAIAGADGNVLMGPMDVMDQGRMLLAADPSGALIGFWQPGQHRGAGLVNQPGTLSWNELVTPDLGAAVAFYGEVCGYEFEEVETGEDGPEYRTFHVGGRAVGGMLSMSVMPEHVTPHWVPYLAVEDADDATARARDLGGSVFVEPTDSPFGRWSNIADAQGAVLTLVQLPEGMADR